MVFNWFRRPFGKNPTEVTAPATTPEPEVVTPEPEAVESASPEAYLDWAKEAYKNIQQRRGQPDIPTGLTPTPESAPEPAPELTEALTETPAPVEPVIEPVAESVAESVAEPIESQENPEKVETLEPETPTGPAWLQKSDRLEVLKETAIASPVVEAPLVSEPVNLDDDFLWSAKVLADQGRSAQDVSEDEINWLSRLRQGLTKTRRNLVNQLKSIVGQGPLNQDAVLEIEALLLQADVGVEATDYIINTLQTKLKEEALPPEQAIDSLKDILREILDRPFQTLSQEFVPEKEVLNIWLLTGVNGAGKTTTIGKLAHLATQSGYSCLIAAADTFRAAAVEQVQVWGERTGTTVIANPGQNTDPAAVVFDGISAAQAKKVDLLLVDTAGRLQNKKNLMDELAKIRRIIDKKAPDAKVESLLVLDSTLGQNGLRQAEVFAEAAKLSGVVLTKLDGTAKGGVALAVTQQLNLPIRFIGAGEGIEDLRPFSSYEFVEALLNG
ncbi:MAG: signal recognition particle-docking protein FtsY [Microcystaceae cyanobacterium]